MKAINITASDLYLMDLNEAPKKWEDLPEIKAQEPKKGYDSSVLQRYGKTRLCQWYARAFVGYEPVGDLFYIAGQ